MQNTTNNDDKKSVTFDQYYKAVVHVLLNGNDEQVKEIWRVINTNVGNMPWLRMKLLSECYGQADAKGKEEFCLLGIKEHLKAGTAKPLDEQFVDPETNIHYRVYQYTDGEIYRIPIVTEGMDKYAFDTALNKHFLGELLRMRTAGDPKDVKLYLLSTQEQVDACNAGDYWRKYPGRNHKLNAEGYYIYEHEESDYSE